MSKLYKRHFLLTAALILVSFFLLGAAFITLSYRYTLQERRATIDRDAQYVADLTASLVEQGFTVEHPSFQATLSNVSLISNADVILVDGDGTVLYCYSDTPGVDFSGQVLTESQLSQFAAAGGYQGVTDLGLYATKQYVSAVPIYAASSNQPQGYSLISSSTANQIEMWRMLCLIFLAVAAVVIIIAFISCYFSSLHVAKPLAEMADSVRRFGQGEFDVRVDPKNRKDEVGQLAVAFNTMADSLAQAETRRQEFVANVSHELKTPMTTISGYTDGILDGTIPMEKAPEYLQLVSSETKRLARLVRKMLDLSELQAEGTVTGHERFDLGENMYQMLFSLENKINARHLDMDIQIPDEPIMVWGEPDEITQVGYNLMDNAIKFSPEGDVLGLSIVTKGSKAYVTIRNHGETIDPQELNLIFDRFHKTDHSRSKDKDSWGLGLYIVKTILNNHKEDITVTSENGVTAFTFTMTLAK